MKYIDMHIHMEDYSLESIRSDRLYIHNSMELNSYKRTLKKFQSVSNVLVSFGIHPIEAYSSTIDRAEIIPLIEDSPLIGEIGLDFHWVTDEKTYPKQIEVFTTMLEICRDYNKIPMIHTKGAEREVLSLLEEYNIYKSLIHWYSGPVDLIEQYLDIGAYFTIGPDIYTDSSIYREIPLNRLFLETDNPTGTPWIVGEERDIKEVYNYFSKLTGFDEKQLKIQILNNYKKFISEKSKNP